MSLNPIHAFHNLVRLTEISSVLIRNGFREFLEQIETPRSWLTRNIKPREGRLNLWERIRVTAEELGPTFVKFGQVLSTRADVLPEPLIQELKRLRNQVKPAPWEDIRPMLERELKGRVEEVFAEFDQQPVAAGSIAQVYRARLPGGALVALKVQRPNIRKEMKADLEIIRWFAEKMQQHLPELRAYDLPAVVDETGENMLRELDFTIEARNATYFNHTNPYPQEVFAPRIHDAFTTRKLLVYDWVEGVEPEKCTLPPETRARIAQAGGRSTFDQIIMSGFFHADPHSGNVLVTPDARLCLIDWGQTGQLTRTMRYFLADLFSAITDDDPEKIVRVALANALTKKRVDSARLEKDIGIMLRKYSDEQKGRDIGRIMLDLLYVFGTHGIRLARDYALLAKATLAIEETGKALDPAFDIRPISEPFLQKLNLERWHPRTMTRMMYWDWRTALRHAREIPGTFMRLLRNLEEGEASINFVHHGLDGLRRSLEDGVNRLVLAIIVASTLLSCSLIVARVSPESLHKFPYVLAEYFFVAAIIFGCWLMYETLRSHRRK
ncbi:MAG TPA: AarF/UbiB family protein [Opitutales bacterium]|nr:AarF/UbiB family protein [Opitutales bacterium]